MRTTTARKSNQSTDSPTPKKVMEIRKYLRTQRYQRERANLDERFQFSPLPHEDVTDYVRDVKRIQKTLELDDISFLPMSDLHRGIRMMMLCAGHIPSEEAPLDTQFQYAMQRVHDWHHGRTMTSNEEWARVGAVEHAAKCIRRTLDEIDEERKANREASLKTGKKGGR